VWRRSLALLTLQRDEALLGKYSRAEGASERRLSRRDRPFLCAARREKRQTGQCRQRLRPSSLHDGGAVIFDRALADAKIRGDVLARLAGEHPFHHVALSRRETSEVSRRRFSYLQQLVRILRQFESALDACDEFLAADRLFDEIQRARFHGLNRHVHIGIAGDHDRRQMMALLVKFLDQF
jgi:hypothetical protein